MLVLFLVRNPKDNCLSYYNHWRKYGAFPFSGSFGELFDLYLEGLVPFGCYWNYIKEVWAKREHPNLHIVFYEDLKKNLITEIGKLNNFLKFNLNSKDIERVAEHVSLPNMKQREAKIPVLDQLKGSFFAEAKIGGWNNVATPDMNKKIDAWIEEQSRGLDIEFQFQ